MQAIALNHLPTEKSFYFKELKLNIQIQFQEFEMSVFGTVCSL